MSSDFSKLKERVSRLEKSVRRIREELAILPETVDPLNPKSWKYFDDLDRQILTLLLQGKPLSTVEVAHKIGKVHRTKIWRRLKKIYRVSQRSKGDSIVVFDPSSKKWMMNTEEFEFKGLVENEKLRSVSL